MPATDQDHYRRWHVMAPDPYEWGEGFIHYPDAIEARVLDPIPLPAWCPSTVAHRERVHRDLLAREQIVRTLREPSAIIRIGSLA